MARIHPEYGTPFWSVITATGTIVGLIVTFITLFSGHGIAPVHVLGLEPLTGFATFNLLVPLSVVNGALIYSRRNFPDLERGFRMPGVPVLPVVGIVANLALIYQLPNVGVLIGTGVVLFLLATYRVWGGAPDVEEMFERVVEPAGPSPTPGGAAAKAGAADGSEGETVETTDGPPDGVETTEEGLYRILVPVARPNRAVRYARLAALLGRAREGTPLVQLVTVTNIPEQTPSELVADTARERADRIQELLAGADPQVEYTVEGHVCRDVAFDIVQTAREDEADMILMGYPEENPEVAEKVEYRAPCDVAYASGFPDDPAVETVNVGVGGGPHHRALLPLVNALGAEGSEVHLISVDPQDGPQHKAEDPAETLTELADVEKVQVHNVSAASIAEGLVSTAAGNGGVLLIGASRDRRLRQWVFGSTPDRVIDLAGGEGVPVVVYASAGGVPERIEDYVFPVYTYLRGLVSSPGRRGEAAES